jgi:REP element-mobilizing transposase RayT/DNA-binding MarR family transcriptional regulator
MARQARIDYPYAYHHIISRGFKREFLFEDSEDYLYYLNCLKKFKNYGYKILEYCLLPNEIHLLLKTGNRIRLQKILKSINTRYALYKSKKRGYSGPVFQGRPKSILIIDEKYLKIIARYILREPMKIGLVEELIFYEWNSYKLLTILEIPEWYDNSEILNSFSENKSDSFELYKRYINEPLKNDEKVYPLEIFNGIAGGTKLLYEIVKKKINNNLSVTKANSIKTENSWLNHINKILYDNKITIKELKLKNTHKHLIIKQKIAYILKEIYHLETKKIVEYLSISQSTLSRYIKKLQKNERSVPEFCKFNFLIKKEKDLK